MTPKIVDRDTYCEAVYDHEDYIREPIETYKRCVVEHYTANDVYFASAEYVKHGPGMEVVTTYRVCEDYLPKQY